MWKNLDIQYDEITSYIELLHEGEDISDEAQISLNLFSEYIDKIEIHKLLNEKDDHRNAILTIHPGAGGTESEDWANMLFRLYTRWCEKNNYKINILDIQDGDVGGIKDVSFEIIGHFAYGNL